MKTIKKVILATSALCALSCAVAGLSACGEHEHNYGEWVITAPTAEKEGSAVKTCSADGCDQKTVTVTLPVLGNAAYAKTDDTATCTAAGTATYTYAKDGALFSFEAATPAKGHGELAKTEAKAKTCTEDGYEAYWTCPDCKQKFSDADGTTEISAPVVIHAGHDADLYHVEATASTCNAEGTAEYWLCRSCYQKFGDADGETAIDEVKTTPADPEAHLPLEHMEAIPASCTEQGTAEYWYCPGCLQKYGDSEGSTEITEPAKTPIKHADVLEHVDAVPATCAAAGTAEYWYCPDCGQKFSNAAGTAKIVNPAAIPKGNHTVEEKAGTDFPASVTLPNGTTMPKSNNKYYECTVCHKLFTTEACTTEITNPAKYSSRGGGVLLPGNNLMCVTTAMTTLYFNPEESGRYVFILNGCTFTRIGHMATADEVQNGMGVIAYNSGSESVWQTTKTCFVQKDSVGPLGDALYVDLNANEVLYLYLSGITKDKVFSVDVEKTDMDKEKNNLLLGDNTIIVNESDNENGAEWIFTAPKQGLYSISVPADSAAYVMTSDGNTKKACLSAPEGTTSYIFNASQGEQIAFYMAIDTNGGATFPATYTVTVSDKVSFPELKIGEYSKVNISGGYSSYDTLVVAEQDGTYLFKIDVSRHAMTAGRNNYTLFVNGVKVGTMYAGMPTEANKVWILEITLAAGINTISIENSAPQNQTVSSVPIGVFAAE